VLLTEKWPTFFTAEQGVSVVIDDLLRYYTKEAPPPGAGQPKDLIAHTREELFGALDELRAQGAGKIVNLHSDWRMWLSWMASRGPIVCLGGLGEGLRLPVLDKLPQLTVEHRHVFLLAGYKVDGKCGGNDLVKVASDIGRGLRDELDVPVTWIIRDSGNPRWGTNGLFEVPHQKFFGLFREAFGLLRKKDEEACA
jgi:hypothetical protein